MDAVAAFADEVRAYSEWLLHGTDEGPAAAGAALRRLIALYTAALALPSAWSQELNDGREAPRISIDEWRAAFDAARRLPVTSYVDTVSPIGEPEIETSNLSDDLAGIYGDITAGLRAFEAGDRPSAIWEWGFQFYHHWGTHAANAIRALHCWLSENHTVHLSAGDEQERSG